MSVIGIPRQGSIMTTRNYVGLSAADGSIGGRGVSGVTAMKAAGFFVVMAGVCLYGEPAHAAIWDPVLDIFDETTLAFETVVARFILLFGLVGAWVYAGMTKSFANGFIGSLVVIAFAGLVAGTDTIATELGFPSGGGGGGRAGR